MMHRLDAHAGEWLDRSAALRFTFEGREYQGYSGDTISSALAARVSAINTFGGLWRDKARVLDRFARLLPVGFYYKAFHSKALFPRWERMFRALTGLGTVTLGAAREATPKRYGFCDVLVIGGGPSGLAAALAAAQAGAQVALVDESLRLTGNGAPTALARAVRDSASITLFPATVAAGYYADHWVALAQQARMTKMRAGAVVFATGVIEQPAVFRNNDLPGVMLASGAARLAARHSVAPGRRVVIIAANLDAYATCLELHARGVRVAAIVDLRAAPESDAAVSACAALGLALLRAHAPYEAVRGPEGTVAGLMVAPVNEDGHLDASAPRRIDCDAILMSVGWAAAMQLYLQAGGSTRFSEELQQFIPVDSPPGIFAAGRMNGVYDLESRLADGRRAGSQAAAHAGFGMSNGTVVARSTRCPSHRFPIVDHPQAKNFVDFDEDLQVKDLENAAQEGFDSSELLKRYSTVGMGPSQGKHARWARCGCRRATGEDPNTMRCPVRAAHRASMPRFTRCAAVSDSSMWGRSAK